MSDYTVADVSYDQDGEIEQFLVFWDSGEPDTRRATTENILLFDPENNLPTDGGLQDFFDGSSAVKLNKDPEIVVAQSGDEHSFIIAIDGEPVETVPDQSESVLQGMHQLLVEDDHEPIESLYRNILNSQVRRDVVNAILITFNGGRRIEITSNGWLVDDFYLVDWNANMYADNDNQQKDDYIRSGDEAVTTDKSHEFVRLRSSMNIDNAVSVVIEEKTYDLTDREILFLAKVKWLLDREHYHPDKPFWTFCDRFADVSTESPNLDKFSI